VRQETSHIDAQYESKYKRASMAQQITSSNITNKSRLRILSARQEVLDSIFEDARKRLPEIQKDQKKYGVLLKNLILEVVILETCLIVGNVCVDGQRTVYPRSKGRYGAG
jgi:V-type H+-transporting ATPase subunit E